MKLCLNNLSEYFKYKKQYLALIYLLLKADAGQNALSFIGFSIWNETLEVRAKTEQQLKYRKIKLLIFYYYYS